MSSNLPHFTEQQTSAKSVIEVPWQAFILHPQLKEVLQLALDNNRDMRVSMLNIQRARALYRVEKSARLPHVDLIANCSHIGLSDSQSATGEATTTHEYTVGLGAVAYEIDLFGRVRNLEQSALQNYLATEWA